MIIKQERDVIPFLRKKVIVIKKDGSTIKGTLLRTHSEEWNFRSGYCELIIEQENNNTVTIPITDCRTMEEKKEAPDIDIVQ